MNGSRSSSFLPRKPMPTISDLPETKKGKKKSKADLMSDDLDKRLQSFMSMRKPKQAEEGAKNATWKAHSHGQTSPPHSKPPLTPLMSPMSKSERATRGTVAPDMVKLARGTSLSIEAPKKTRNLGRTTSLGLEFPRPLLGESKRHSSGESNKSATRQTKQKVKEFQRLIRGKIPPGMQQDMKAHRTFLPDGLSPRAGLTSVSSSTDDMSSQNSPRSQSNASWVGGANKDESQTNGAMSASSNGETNDKVNRFLRLQKSQQQKQQLKDISEVDASQANQTQGGSSRTQTSAGEASDKINSDKINRFLRLQNSQQQKNTEGSEAGGSQQRRGSSRSQSSLKRMKEGSGSFDDDNGDAPPIKEISVFPGDGPAPPPASTAGISLSPDVVKEVFPYHIVLDADFRIIQIGDSLSRLFDHSVIDGRVISELLAVASPLPMFGQWQWESLDKMKDKTIFLESKFFTARGEKVKLKGTLIEVSKEPKQVMLALFPNVKNLSELEEMNLSMADLPLHSCQREAVLLGEHSRSEVNLTNHLDMLHRELIDSMEQQIKDRTEELAEANQDLENANDQLAIQSARQLEHFACMSHEIR